MKRPVEPGQSDEAPEEPLSSPPKPFDMFAGLVQEPLPPAESESKSTKLSGTFDVRREGVVDSGPGGAEQSTIEAVTVREKQSSRSVYVFIAAVALVIGLVVGFLLK